MTKETISRYLENGCKGHKNVVSSRELERALGISGNELRRHINRLRRGTVPIAADQRGYYYAETAAEEDVYPPQKAPAAPAVSSRSLFACTWRRLSPEVSPIKR